MILEIDLGDIITTKKQHPCGSITWTVIRVGADIKIKCRGCGHIVMMDRADLAKRVKKIERSGKTDA